jgi:hypothetical protein
MTFKHGWQPTTGGISESLSDAEEQAEEANR